MLEPSVEESVDILRGLKTQFEKHHEVRYTAPALRTAAELSARYINDRQLPDKAIDVIDEAGARRHALAPASKRRKTIGVGDIERVISKMARIPPKTVSASDRDALRTLEGDLKRVVFGQDSAIKALVSAIKLSRSGLGNPDKPICSFLFSGPTGVWQDRGYKTACLNTRHRTRSFRYVRVHGAAHRIPIDRRSSRLCGIRPGGATDGSHHSQSARRAAGMKSKKAHPDVFNLLLQVMDYGTLTDNNGRKADFRNVIIVMTTNAGASRVARGSLGFVTQDHSTDDTEVINKLFTPEFRNRLDSIIRFGGLDENTISHVVISSSYSWSPSWRIKA